MNNGIPPENTTTNAQDDKKTVIEQIYSSVGTLDLQEAMKYHISEKILFNTLEDFYEDLTDKAGKIERLSVERDYKNYSLLVHSFKSGARLIGAVELSEMAGKLEEAVNLIIEESSSKGQK